MVGNQIAERNIFNNLNSINSLNSKSLSETEPEEHVGGYCKEYVLDTLPSRLLCNLCGELMRDAIQTSRGQLACNRCYLIAKGDSNICPIDHCPVDTTFPDRATGLEILNLTAACKFHNVGCKWRGTIREMEKHYSSCQHEPSKCLYCKKSIGDLHEHLEKFCEYLNELTTCPYQGCNFKPTATSNMYMHLKDYTFLHMALMEPHVQAIKENDEKFQKQLSDAREDFTKQKTEHEQQVNHLTKTVTTLTKQMSQMQVALENLSKQTMCQQKKFFGTDTNESETANLTASLASLQGTMQDLDIRQQLFENTTYNGKMMWKIDKFKLRRQQALTGKVTALHSAPGFTDRYGYKFCARLYLNGDGTGSCTHVSLFFVLMKSEYDNVNKWPFKHRVTFKLTTQEGVTKPIKESFLPDENSSSFKKPQKDMNIAAGCPMFIPIEDLENGGFIKDDSFFIEISVTK